MSDYAAPIRPTVNICPIEVARTLLAEMDTGLLVTELMGWA